MARECAVSAPACGRLRCGDGSPVRLKPFLPANPQNGLLSRASAPSRSFACSCGGPCSSCRRPTAMLVSMTSRQRSKRRS